jgi:hypothetical protein
VSILVWAVIAALVVVVLAFSTCAALVGLVGSLGGRGFECCPRCHRYGLSLNGEVHENGCHPLHVELTRVAHWRPRHLGLHH